MRVARNANARDRWVMQTERILLPVTSVVFVLFALVLPVLRHRRRTGASGIAPLTTRDPRQRAIGVVLGAVLLALGALVAIFAVRGPEALLPVALPGAVRILGWALIWAAIGIIVLAQAQMGLSWRIGIDDGSSTELVTRGLFAFVRHPIFSAMHLALAGVALVVASPFALAILLAAAIAIHLEIRMEETHLLRQHGDRYREYQRRVGRLVPWPRG